MSAETLAELSDQLVLGSVLLYLAAMIGFALELAYGRASTDAPAKRRVRQPVAVGAVGGVPDGEPAAESAVEPADASAGASADVSADGPADGSAGGPAQPPAEVAPARWALTAGKVALALAWVGWAANLGAIFTRGLAVGRWPWGNMYEFVVAICFAAVTAFLATQLRANVRFVGPFVMLVVVLGLGAAVRFLYTSAGPVVPALNSYWIAIHVSAAILASGLFILAGTAGVLYLIRGDGLSRLPAKADLERVAHRAIVLAFPLWTFAVIAGALWADKAWGRYWGWDPKEVWSFITWVAYAAYLHARVTAGWRGKAATIVQLVALGCLLFNLVGVNIFLGGLHSYADVSN
ncbi:cytochrome c biogenesis protein CcsA [Nonomuraea typhae]|uniref:Cytochrome c biogenesis protein CcsA n=1 Tax=Nonomuraea typhae TaxID=2603600 RepID=A0ABW7Z233_9ACTN